MLREGLDKLMAIGLLPIGREDGKFIEHSNYREWAEIN